MSLSPLLLASVGNASVGTSFIYLPRRERWSFVVAIWDNAVIIGTSSALKKLREPPHAARLRITARYIIHARSEIVSRFVSLVRLLIGNRVYAAGFG